MARIFRTADDVINGRIFEKSIDLILVTNKNGDFIRVSPSSVVILGYAPDEMIGRNGTEFVYPDDLENVRQMMRDQHHGGITRHFDCRYVNKSGNVVLLTWTGVWAPEEEQHFFIGRDITDARIFEQYQTIAQEIERMQRSIKDLQERVIPTIED